MESSPETPPKRLPITDEEFEQVLIGYLRKEWPGMTREEREFYSQENPERVAASGLLLDAPFVKKRRGK